MSLTRRICIVARLIHGRTCQVAQASQRSYLLLLRRRSEENEGGNLEWEGFMHVSRLHEPENGRLHGVGSRQRDDTGGSCHLDHSAGRESKQDSGWNLPLSRVLSVGPLAIGGPSLWAMVEDEKGESEEWPVPQFPINEAVAVQPSPLGSSGLFALRDFAKGDGACVVRARSCTRSAFSVDTKRGELARCAVQRCSKKHLFCRY